MDAKSLFGTRISFAKRAVFSLCSATHNSVMERGGKTVKQKKPGNQAASTEARKPKTNDGIYSVVRAARLIIR
jgi:hypothetical protein